MNRIFRYLSFLISILILSACANTKRLSEGSRSSLKTICMANPIEVIFPKSAFFMSHGQGWAMSVGAGLGGAVGGVIIGAASSGKRTERQLINDYLRSEPLPFSVELVNIFSDKIQSKTRFALSCDDGYDAKVSIHIKEYGITYVPFTKSYRPILTLYAEIVDSSGKVLWKNLLAEYANSAIVEIRRRDDWFNKEDSQATMKEGFSKLTESILDRFASHLSGDYSYLKEDMGAEDTAYSDDDYM